jgi:hypothetical protein
MSDRTNAQAESASSTTKSTRDTPERGTRRRAFRPCRPGGSERSPNRGPKDGRPHLDPLGVGLDGLDTNAGREWSFRISDVIPTDMVESVIEARPV